MSQYLWTWLYICIHFPTPDPSPPSLWTASLTSGSVTSAAGLAAGPDGCLLELDYLPCCKVVCLWCIMCFCCWGVFPVLTLYSPRSIVWGLFFSSSLFSCYAVFFFKNPCISLLIVLCMIVYVTNKPTLTLTLNWSTHIQMWYSKHESSNMWRYQNQWRFGHIIFALVFQTIRY